MDGSEAAFDALFRAHHDLLLRFAVRRVGVDDAPDVVAEVFLVAWRRRADLPAVDAQLWLFGVARNVVANTVRGERRRAKLLDHVSAQPVVLLADPGERVAASATVLDALASLPEREQEALRLVEWDGLTASAAASVVGCSAATFRVRLHRARRHLAVALAEHGARENSAGAAGRAASAGGMLL